MLLSLIIFFIPLCWSFNGPGPGGLESKREKEADILWFTWKAKRVSPVLRAHAAARRHQEPSQVGEGAVRLL